MVTLLVMVVPEAVPPAQAPAGSIMVNIAPNNRTVLSQRTVLFWSVRWVFIFFSFSRLQI
jgi:hypothetical protein